MTAPAFTATGTKSGAANLPKTVFSAKIIKPLMAQAVKVFLSNQRQSSAQPKTRGQVVGTTKKIYRQKGTGRARHGAKTAPIFVGGGVSHGPSNQKNYKLKLPQTIKQKALKSALSVKRQDNQLAVIADLKTIKPKTKVLQKILTIILTKLKAKPNAKVTLVISQKTTSLTRASGNLKHLKVILANQLNTYQVLNGGTLIFTKPALKKLATLLKWSLQIFS